jgi:tRNA C32,U32 (ribose-2'-O)-methylase TrmJ
MNVRIVLVGARHPGNIGSTARAMKTMGLFDLAWSRRIASRRLRP